MDRRTFGKAVLASAMVGATPAFAAEKVFRVAMTAADIPLTTGQASQGSEGVRFMGVTAYDALCNWELSHSDRPVGLRPGLATSWSVDPARTTRWIFKLREGVTFHDGSAFDSSSVVWNLDKLILSTSPQYDTAQVAQAATWTGVLASYRAVDKYTVELITKQPDANLPYEMANIFMSSPARWQEMGKDWTKVGLHPSGTGPWAVDKVVPRERVEFVRNAAYWDKARIPKCDRMIILPMPDAVTRVSALLNGQIDWVEAPPPDTIGQLKQAGMQIVLNTYPHIWPYLYSTLPDSPFKDVRVRHAMNFAVDREGLCTLLGGTAIPAKGLVPPGHPWFGKPTVDVRYDPDLARKYLADAGYGPSNKCKVTFLISTAGSGQMQPLPMNEAIKESLEDVGFEVTLNAMDWESLRARRRAGAMAPENKGAHALNNSLGSADPTALIQAAYSQMAPPKGLDWGFFKDDVADDLCQRAMVEFDVPKQDALMAQLHARIVDQAMWCWVVHDLNPRALSPRLKGFVQARSWFQDLTPVDIV
jgi:ABC-type transport system substrate-binding protein